MNQGKLEVVKQEMTRVNIEILGILNLTKMTIISTTVVKNPLEEMEGFVDSVNKRVRNAILECSLKNDRMISVQFQSKPFNTTVIQVYALTSNAEEAEVEWLYQDLKTF